jgi:hypothetical protein
MYMATACMLLIFCQTAVAGEWWENVRFNGDLRYRYELIDAEGKPDRNRHRIRARLGMHGKVNGNMTVGIQLATGSDDPVSTNQTIGDGFSSKNVVLDLAYFEAKHDALPGMKLTAGKFKNPFYKPGKSELIWDSDWNPEGGAVTFSRDHEDITITIIGAGLYVEERKADEDSYIAAGQGVLKYNIDEKQTSVSAGAGFFGYVNAEGYSPFFDSDDPSGNSVDTLGHYANGYDLIELFAEATHQLDDIPVTVMADFVTNTSADSLDTGWLLGLRVGRTKMPGSWSFRYIYREVERDAVLGTFTDSDFRGGGTDGRGHEIGGAVQVMKNAALKASYFINEIGLEEQKDFNRLQVDLQLKFK